MSARAGLLMQRGGAALVLGHSLALRVEKTKVVATLGL